MLHYYCPPWDEDPPDVKIIGFSSLFS
ncbi:hypothetical protein A2U01_0083824, partial [Trifolium medium]|nr:hypothetical protein [Trifolium medium]